MQNNKNNSGNKSLFLYTALIFVAAILIIVVAFFGQKNIINSQTELPAQTAEPSGDGITQKAAMISELNSTLTKQNESLTTLNEELTNDKKELEQRISELEINYTNGNIFCTIYQYIHDKNFDDAKEALSMINPDSLTDAQKIIYNNIKKILN